MIIKCSNEWKQRIFSYIGRDYEKCLYIYADLKKYGMDSEYVMTWVNIIDDNIKAVLMQYHNGMHIYSDGLDYDKEEIVALIQKMRPSMVLGVQTLILDIANSLEEYHQECGYIKRMKEVGEEYEDDNIRMATVDDVVPLTEMLMSDVEFSVGYTFDEMYRQISERILDEYGKTFYICDQNQITAQLGIAAELDDIIVISNVYTAKTYRNQGYAAQLFSYIKQISANKKIYLFCYGDSLDRYYDKMGFETVQLWGKCIRQCSN